MKFELIEQRLKQMLFAVVSSSALFLFMTFLHDSLLAGTVFAPVREQVSLYFDYLIVPWAGILTALWLAPGQGEKRLGWDVRILLVLMLWLIAPFALRFGATKANVNSWFRHVAVFFAIYAIVSQGDAAYRTRQLRCAQAVFSVYAVVLGVLLLTMAWRVQEAYAIWGDYGFGVCDGIYLCSGIHYNSLGMAANCLLMMCLSAAAQKSCKWLRIVGAVGAAEMALVVILTQSRTSRYAMLIALACGALSAVACGGWHRRAGVRFAAGVLAAAVMAVGGFVLCDLISDGAIAHYNRVAAQRAAAQDETLVPSVIASAIAEESDGQPAKELKGRDAIDSTFSDRTNIWGNIIEYWKNNPKDFMIGNGAWRSFSLIAEDTIHENAGYVPMHNGYLQFIADYGMIGFVLLCAFLVCCAKHALAAFFAPAAKRRPEELPLCMLIIAALATGMMENAPLEALTPMNIMLFFAMAVLAGRGRESL